MKEFRGNYDFDYKENEATRTYLKKQPRNLNEADLYMLSFKYGIPQDNFEDKILYSDIFEFIFFMLCVLLQLIMLWLNKNYHYILSNLSILKT